MRRKGLVVLLALLVLAGCFLVTCQAYAQGKIRLITDEGPMPVPNYVGWISEQELDKIFGCKLFPKASCSDCGVTHYRSETVRVATKESFDELRSWLYNALKYEIQQRPAHKIIEKITGAMALSDWSDSAYGVVEQESEKSPWYIYVVFVLEEWGQRVVYRMNAGGVVENMIYPDRRAKLAVLR